MRIRSLSARRYWIPALILAILPMAACGRYKARHELERNDYYAQILQRVDRQWIGNDRFFENNLLYNPYPEVRQWCALALGRIASPRGLPMLYQAIRRGDAPVRAAAAFSIGEIRDRERVRGQYLPPDQQAVSELCSLLDDSSVSVQMRAIEALGKTGSSPEALEIVRRLQQFPAAERRSPIDLAYLGFAITALVRLGDPAAVPVFERLAKAPDPRIGSRASEALLRLRDKIASPLPDGQPPSNNPQPLDPFSMPNRFGSPQSPEDPGPVESSVTEVVSRALAASRKNSTIAIVETNRGTLEIELFREDAPLTVAGFVLAAKRGNYNSGNFVFEQVVPSQQIGGQVTGPQPVSGWARNGEVNMRPFERGSVGITVSQGDPDHSRLFLALAPQPYLDGIDTCFGRVISGMPVADRILPGDKILRIDIKETISFLDHIRY